MEKIIARAQATYMSNTKWRKLISVIERSELKIIESQWQLAGNSYIYKSSGFPKTCHINETGFTDSAFGPPHPFRYIERLIIPQVCEDPRSDKLRPLAPINQPINELAILLMAAAQFPIILTEEYLEIKAYSF